MQKYVKRKFKDFQSSIFCNTEEFRTKDYVA